MLNIHSIETFGTHEGPGIRFVIFTQACNFKCLYCHNPDTQPSAMANIKNQNSKIKNNEYSIEKLVEMIENDRPYFGKDGGVTISGGEPLLQAKEITELFQKLKTDNIHTALDTNGSILNDEVKELLEYTDLVLLDIKHFDPEWHQKVTGFKSETVPSLAFLEYLEEIRKPVWIRYVLVPGLTDQKEYLIQLGDYLSQSKTIERIEVLPYHTLGVEKYEKLGWNYALTDTKLPDDECLEKTKQILANSNQAIYIR